MLFDIGLIILRFDIWSFCLVYCSVFRGVCDADTACNDVTQPIGNISEYHYFHTSTHLEHIHHIVAAHSIGIARNINDRGDIR